MNMQKKDELAVLATKRKEAHLEGYYNLADVADGKYECDFVSPFTKTAGNFDSEIFVFLQDWSSAKAMADGPDDEETIRLGYTPSVKTNKNLQTLLRDHFGKELGEIYATNLFPLIKPGDMSNKIPQKHLKCAAIEFGLPQVKIVRPHLVIVLGLASYQALRLAADGQEANDLNDAIANPFDHLGARFWCQAHPGWIPAKRGSWAQVTDDWRLMAEWYRRDLAA